MSALKLDEKNTGLMVARVIDDLRRQGGFLFADGDKNYAVFPAEYVCDELLANMPSDRQLLITAARARSLGIDKVQSPLCLNVNKLCADDVLALADPTSDNTPKTPAQIDGAAQFDLLLSLTKQASLLPALLITELDDVRNIVFASWEKINRKEIENYLENPELEIIKTAKANLPIKNAENTQVISYRIKNAAAIHLAIIIGDPSKSDTPLVRIHSSCVTGDILGSLRCDCGDQLHMAIDQISKHGCGIILYLHQEGRGIGLTNKLKAYALQEKGIDTYEANLMLGFDEDERNFAIAAAILETLNIKRIKLLTNNPLKLKTLEQHGVVIGERVELIAKSGAHNHAYMEAKSKKAGHLF